MREACDNVMFRLVSLLKASYSIPIRSNSPSANQKPSQAIVAIMPKAPSSSPVKSNPYEKSSPTKQRAVGVKGVSWTDDMDRDLISYVLSISDINLRYNWPDLQKNKFPGLTPKQLKSRWDNKLKNSLFPPEVMKLSKEAKSKKDSSANAEGSE